MLRKDDHKKRHSDKPMDSKKLAKETEVLNNMFEKLFKNLQGQLQTMSNLQQAGKVSRDAVKTASDTLNKCLPIITEINKLKQNVGGKQKITKEQYSQSIAIINDHIAKINQQSANTMKIINDLQPNENRPTNNRGK